MREIGEKVWTKGIEATCLAIWAVSMGRRNARSKSAWRSLNR
jgi:hypothetical protein